MGGADHQGNLEFVLLYSVGGGAGAGAGVDPRF